MPAAGVYKKELDLSLYAETDSDLAVGEVHTFSKGPINERTLITNLPDLESTFGKPIDDDVACQGFFALREFFRTGNKAYVVRVEAAANPCTYPKTALRGVTDDSLANGSDGATSVPATRTLTSAGAAFDTSGVLVGDILAISGGSADDGFYKITNVTGTVLTVDRDWPTGSLSGLDYTVYTSKVEEGSDGATSLPTSRQFTSAGAEFITDGIVKGDVLVISDSADKDDNGYYTIEAVTSETTLVVNRDFPSGELSSLDYSVYGYNSPDMGDGDTSADGEFSSATSKFNLHNVKAGDLLIIDDSSSGGDNGTYLITGLKSGSEDTTLEISGSWPTGSLTGLSFKVVPGVAIIQGESKGSWANGYTIKTVVDSNDSTKFDIEVYDQGSFLVEKIYGLTASTIEAAMSEDSALFTASAVSGRAGPAIDYEGEVAGGTDGTTGIVDSDLIGVGNKGLQLFKNKEEVEVDLLAISGYSSENIGDALINMCEYRGDCMPILDPPDSPTVDSVQDLIDFHNGQGSLGRTTAPNSSYGAIYGPWIKIYDVYHSKYRWTAPSGHAFAVYGETENQAKPWYAPAGLRRGKVSGGVDVRFSPDEGERLAMQVGNNFNPIVKFVKEGIYIYGQKTLLRSSSALNRVSTRRMLFYLERHALKAIKQVVFEPNDSATDREIVRVLTPLFEYVKAYRGLNDFLIIVDDTTSPPSVRQQNKLIGKAFIKPTSTAEVIELQFVLTAQTLDFSELIAS